MPTTVKLTEFGKPRKLTKAAPKNQIKRRKEDDDDDEAPPVERDDDSELAAGVQKNLTVGQTDTEMGGTAVFGVEGHEQEPCDSDSKSSSTLDSGQLDIVMDDTTREYLKKLMKSHRRFKDKQEEKNQRLFAVTRSLGGRVTELEQAADPAAMIWPPKDWTAADIRSYVLPEWNQGRIGLDQGVTCLVNPYEVPLVFNLSDTSAFPTVRDHFQSLHSDIRVIQRNGSSLKMQTRQINSLKSQLVQKQRNLVGEDSNLHWYFRLSFPQTRHIKNGVADNADNWPIDVLTDPPSETYRTLVQCEYNHTGMAQRFNIDEKVVNLMGWPKESLKESIDGVLRMYRFELTWFDESDPDLQPLGKFKLATVNKLGKGQGKYVNRAQSVPTFQVETKLTGPIPGVADTPLPASLTVKPPPPIYPMAIGTGKKGIGSKGDGKYGKGKSGFPMTGFFDAGKSGKKGDKSKGWGKKGKGKGHIDPSLMGQLAMLLQGGGDSYGYSY